MSQQVLNVFEEQNFGSIIAELANQANDLEKRPAALVIEPELYSCLRERLAGKSRREDIYRPEIVSDDGDPRWVCGASWWLESYERTSLQQSDLSRWPIPP
jgi:hypothetical protein